MSDIAQRLARLTPAQRLLLSQRVAQTRDAAEPIAIVGMACRFAGAPSLDAFVGTGNALSIAANRVSYILDLHGPSLAVDTACSSALVGVHLAVQSLRNAECDTALAGGVNLILAPDVSIAFSKARMLSSD